MTRIKTLTLGFTIALGVLVGSVSVANAQYAPPPNYGPPPGYAPPPPNYGPPPGYGPRGYGYGPPRGRGVYRDGLVIGGSLGFGGISAADPGCGDLCGGVFAIEGHIGAMVNPRLALMADLWANLRNSTSQDATVWSGIYTAALQYWATDILWLKGGFGVGHMQVTSNFDGSFGDEWGPAVLAALGVELIQGPAFALDLQARYGRGFYSQGGDVNNFGVMVGVNWY
jgi:hypothetical protein